jgi:hypothetical protein
MLYHFILVINALVIIMASSLASASKADAELASRVEPGVVIIRTLEQGIVVGHGSGFFISNDGLVLTNHHVLNAGFSSGSFSLTIETKSGELFKNPQVIGCDEGPKKVDLCLLKIPYVPKFFFQVKSATYPKGTDILVLGHPREYYYTLSTGIISGTFLEPVKAPYKTDKNGKYIDPPNVEYTQITAPISRGNSGGPVFDTNGNLVGISDWIRIDAGSENLNFAISATEASVFLASQKSAPISLEQYRKIKGDKTKEFADFLDKAVSRPIFDYIEKNKDSGVSKNISYETTLTLGTHKVAIAIPPMLGHLKCKQKATPTADTVTCYAPAVDSVLVVQLLKAAPGAARGFQNQYIAEPEPLPIVKDLMANGQWKKMESSLTPQQKKYLFSIPEKLSCKEEKKSASYFWNNAYSCHSMVYNIGEPDRSAFFELSQANGDDFLLQSSITIDDPHMSGFLYNAPVLVLGLAKVVSTK